MYNSFDSPDIIFPASGSRLLSESPILPSSSSHTGPEEDLSISELSLASRSFLMDNLQHKDGVRVQEGGENMDESERAEQVKRHAAALREEKLQSDIFILRKLNDSFAMFNEALQDTGSANQRIAQQLGQTDTLLNKYISILSKSEESTRLIFNEKWQGAVADEEIIKCERIEARRKAQHEAEARALTAQREHERCQREERERSEQEERARNVNEKKQRMASRGGGVRGTHRTRAPVRGIRGARGTAQTNAIGMTATRDHPGTTSASQSTITSKLPMPSTGIRSTSSGSSRGGPRP